MYRLQALRCIAPGSRPLALHPPYARTFVAAAIRSRDVPRTFARGEPIQYDELKGLSQQPSDDVIIVDVREPEEVVQGNIPSSVNLPLSSLQKTLRLTNDDFLRQNGFPKPSGEQPMVFYCRTGKRSATAINVAKQEGFRNLRNYEGSWDQVDWAKHEQAK